MSEQVNSLQVEVNRLNQEIVNLKDQNQKLIDTINLRVEEVNAGKDMLGETTQQCLNFRTNFRIVNKNLAQKNADSDRLEKQIEGLNKQLEAATAKIAELQPKEPLKEVNKVKSA